MIGTQSDHSLFFHASRKSSYRTTLRPPFTSAGFSLDETDGSSMPRAESGESNSSSSSSLVYNFLSANEPHFSEVFVPASCIMPTIEEAGSGA